MGTEASRENGGTAASPRISFSHDLSQSDIDDIGRPSDGSLPLDISDAQFDFSISVEMSAQDTSPADDIFSGGKILPIPIKSTAASPSNTPAAARKPIPLPPTLKKGVLKEIIAAPDEDDGNKASDGKRRSFWRFGRSISVGRCGNTGLVYMFPLSLSRSKSTGSYLNPNSNPNPNPSTIQKPPRSSSIIKSNSSSSFRKSLSESEGRNSYYYSRSSNGSRGNGLRINPIINISNPLIPRGGGGSTKSNSSSSSGGGINGSVLAYLLCNCKDKNMKRSAVTCSP